MHICAASSSPDIAKGLAPIYTPTSSTEFPQEFQNFPRNNDCQTFKTFPYLICVKLSF